MGKYKSVYISRREQEIMDIIYQQGACSVSDVVGQMSNEPSYDTVRVTLGILTKKGFLKRTKERKRFIYLPIITRDKASKSAMHKLVKTFFNGSASRAIMTLLEISHSKLTDLEFDKIEAWIAKRKKG
jgi:BlaI family penicillinase repressor